jgi:asparagine synthase (glutamine-hydrolysing)
MEAKEQFSDGVGYNWIDELIDYCATQVTDEQLAGAAIEFPYNSPATKEAYFTGLFLISTIPDNCCTNS